MIRLLDAEPASFAQFCARDVLGLRVLAVLRSYAGLGAHSGTQVWAQYAEDGQTTAALSALDGFAVLCADAAADWEELTAFLRMQSSAGVWRRLQCDADMAHNLPFAKDWRSHILRFDMPCRPSLEGFELVPAHDPAEVYALLENCFDEVKNRALWMADMALRWRRGTAQSWFLRQEGEILSTATASALTEHGAYIGAVGTPPELRGRGYAGELLRRIAAEQQAPGRALWLSCRGEMLEFYRSVGFVEAGEWVTVV